MTQQQEAVPAWHSIMISISQHHSDTNTTLITLSNTCLDNKLLLTSFVASLDQSNDLTIGWKNLNLLSCPNATLAPQARQARASGENLNYMKLAQGKQGQVLEF